MGLVVTVENLGRTDVVGRSVKTLQNGEALVGRTEVWMMAIKPILFNTEMVRALLDGRKTQTRRVVKPQPPATACVRNRHGGTCDWAFWADDDEGHVMQLPYRPGDVLWVPEAWKCVGIYGELGYEVVLRSGRRMLFEFESRERARKWAKYRDKPSYQWQSPYFMPKEAARIFLRAKDVRVERLQDITPEQCITEGADDGSALCEVGGEFVRGMFNDVWDSTIKKADLPRYGWDANPWVWVIDFERCEKPEGWC